MGTGIRHSLPASCGGLTSCRNFQVWFMDVSRVLTSDRGWVGNPPPPTRRSKGVSQIDRPQLYINHPTHSHSGLKTLEPAYVHHDLRAGGSRSPASGREEKKKKKKGHQTGVQHPAVSAQITDQYKRLIMKEATGTASLLLQQLCIVTAPKTRGKKEKKEKIQT